VWCNNRRCQVTWRIYVALPVMGRCPGHDIGRKREWLELEPVALGLTELLSCNAFSRVTIMARAFCSLSYWALGLSEDVCTHSAVPNIWGRIEIYVYSSTLSACKDILAIRSTISCCVARLRTTSARSMRFSRASDKLAKSELSGTGGSASSLKGSQYLVYVLRTGTACSSKERM
jgi:hypothetical protein